MAGMKYIVLNLEGMVLAVYGSALQEEAEDLAGHYPGMALVVPSRAVCHVGESRPALLPPSVRMMPCSDHSDAGLVDWLEQAGVWGN
jgi:hypothetical protein